MKPLLRSFFEKIIPEIGQVEAYRNDMDKLKYEVLDYKEKVEKVAPEPLFFEVKEELRSLKADMGLVDSKIWSEFYTRFEDRYRGSFDDIAQRLRERYLDKFTDIHCDVKRALDIGCGNGETLQILKEAGLEAEGIDISEAAAKRCQGLGFKARTADALEYLRKIEDGAFGCVTFFHVIEHCPAFYNFQVIREIQRVLAPGGIVFVETPNLYCLFVAARQFYLDPTHLRPVHPDFVGFMLEDSGLHSIEQHGFGPVKHPDFDKLKVDTKAGEALDAWLYGDMDICVLAVK